MTGLSRTKAFAIGLTMAVMPAAQAQQTATGASALHRAYAAFAFADSRVLDGLAVLRRHGIDSGPLAARGYARYGLIDQARSALSGWGKKPQATTAWLALARAEYAAGEYVRTEHSLTQLPSDPPPDQARAMASLLARSQLRRGEYDQAALVLSAQQLHGPLDAFDTYNQAIAWLRSGDSARGTAALNRVGQYHGHDRVHAALADQANLALGFYFLREAQGGLARTAFQRIRLRGPFTEKGMVGLGWAELAPGGGVQRLHVRKAPECTAPQPDLWADSASLHSVPRPSCRDNPARTEEDVLAGEPARSDIATAFKRAAVAWDKAAAGDPAVPAVQEALVNLPYALARAGDAERARAAYEQAISKLETVDAHLSADLAALADRGAPLERDIARPPPLSEPRGLLSLQDVPERLGEQLDRQAERLTALAEPPPQDKLIATLGSVLKQLRQDAGHYAPPQAAERGLFIAALHRLGETDAVSRPDPAPVQEKIAQVRDRLAQLRHALDRALWALQRDRIEQQRNNTRKRLQQARIGQALLLD